MISKMMERALQLRQNFKPIRISFCTQFFNRSIPTYVLYTLLVPRDVKKKNTQCTTDHHHSPPKKKETPGMREVLRQDKTIKWTPSGKASSIPPRGKM